MKLNAKNQAAAVLVAEDRFTDLEIARRAHIHRSTLAKWKTHPDFIALVSEYSDTLTAQAMEHGIARRAVRLGVLQEAHNHLLQVIEDRAAAPEMQGVPGGKTGLLIRTEKVIGFGESARTIEEFTFDRAVLQELRAIQEQAAKELGQFVEKRELTGKDGGPLQHELAVTTADIRARLRQKLGISPAGGAIEAGVKSTKQDRISNLNEGTR